ncbi:hypothetical protein ACS0TY_007160 [Phlomoides rotata]
MDEVDSRCGGVFFVYGYGGTGNTFLWRTLYAAIRSRGKLFLTRQFPFIVSYAMTINKSQGQSLSHVGLLLKKNLFLGTVSCTLQFPRVTNRKGLKILICDKCGDDSHSTINIVYKEVFQNL